jgi:hypothetical protein
MGGRASASMQVRSGRSSGLGGQELCHRYLRLFHVAEVPARTHSATSTIFVTSAPPSHCVIDCFALVELLLPRVLPHRPSGCSYANLTFSAFSGEYRPVWTDLTERK